MVCCCWTRQTCIHKYNVWTLVLLRLTEDAVSLQTPTPLSRSSTSLRKPWLCVTPSIPPGTRRSSSTRWRFLATRRSRRPLRPTSWWSFMMLTHTWVFEVCPWASVTQRIMPCKSRGHVFWISRVPMSSWAAACASPHSLPPHVWPGSPSAKETGTPASCWPLSSSYAEKRLKRKKLVA